MCESSERRYKKEKITGVIDILREDGKSDGDIIDSIIKKYQVTGDYVLSLLMPKAV